MEGAALVEGMAQETNGGGGEGMCWSDAMTEINVSLCGEGHVHGRAVASVSKGVQVGSSQGKQGVLFSTSYPSTVDLSTLLIYGQQ